eukprot:TRINITY_DN62933_c0_g1_i1.p1 TRINITY_DN62933_c0_g1~~TRINITY_DN62933_c0_g1_i1.p1  ORF type:complete len:281 (+),score=43.84 TRINITY_DN62933_c0_g1_i1:163-1005(+)
MEASLIEQSGSKMWKDNLLQGLRALGTLLICIGGLLLSSTVGSLAYPIGGVGALFGGALGGMLFLCIGCCVTGFWKDTCRNSLPTSKSLEAMVQRGLAPVAEGRSDFTLILTIHKAENVGVQGRLWQQPDLYVEVSCGNNPVKRTCVKRDGHFNEQFKLHVRSSDHCLTLKVLDQNMFGSTGCGFIALDIQDDIIAKGFPKNRQHPLDADTDDALKFSPRASGSGDKSTPSLYLSFQPVGGSSETAGSSNWGDRKSGDNYGAVAFVQQCDFSVDAEVGRR